MFKAITRLIKRYWHTVFIAICFALVAVIGYQEYQAFVEQQTVQREVSIGHLTNREIHSNGILVLCYHRVARQSLFRTITLTLSNNDQIHDYSVTQQQLTRQLLFLKRHRVRIISMNEAIKLAKQSKPLRHKYVTLTFDDVDATLPENATPVLNRLGHLPYLAFIVTGNTGRYDNGTRLATWPQLKKMQNKSNVMFGVHTYNMHRLRDNKPLLMYAKNYRWFTKDYWQSEQALKKHVGYKSQYFAYPYGEGTNKEQQYFVRHGMITFSLTNAIIEPGQDLTQPLPRTMIDGDAWQKIVRPWVLGKVTH